MIHLPNSFQPFCDDLIFGMTQKDFGSLNDESRDFDFFLKKLAQETKGIQPVFANQMHGEDVMVIKNPPRIKPECDGFITRQKKVPLLIKIADCQGVLIYDFQTKTVAAVHSGWRGSAKNIIGKTIKTMKEMGCKASDLVIAISPSLGSCCAEFSDPFRELPKECHPYIMPKNRVDFWSLSKEQCLEQGVPESQIEITGICTQCHPESCFSHRNGDLGRMGAFIMLK